MTSEQKMPDYVKEAISSFGKIMATSEKDMFENMNRANKGELFVLHFLSKQDTAVTPSDLSVALQSSSARISTLLGSLEKKGQIERDIDKSNRRNILVTVTDAGRERAEMEMRDLAEALGRVFIEMGEVDAMEYLRLKKRFFGLMQKHQLRR